MAKKTVREEVLALYNVTPKDGEEEQALAVRAGKAIDAEGETPEAIEKYNSLSAAARSWYEKAAGADEADVPALPGAKAAKAAPAKKAKPAAKAAKSAVPVKKAKAPKAAPAKKAKKAPKEDDGEKRGSGASKAVIVAVCKNPKLTREQVAERIRADGHVLGDWAMAQVYQRAQFCVATLRELGKLS